MKAIPRSEDSLVLRTDFSDEAAWAAVCAEVREPVGDFRAYVEFLSDPEFAGLTPEQIIRLIPADWDHSFVFIVDRATLADPEHPILVMDLYTEVGRTFRVIPSEIWGPENNLSIGNMDFAEFADAVDPDGVFRGFPET